MAGRARAVLEVLRAPLLLSPIADVVAGWTFVMVATLGPAANMARHDLPGVAQPFDDPALWPSILPPLALSCAIGCCLLAAGMAQNALADLEDDRRRKPDRPLPRGAISVAAVRWIYVSLTAAALGIAGLISTTSLAIVAAIVLLTALYHFVLKPWRVPACAALGGLRGLDALLGVAAATAALEVFNDARAATGTDVAQTSSAMLLVTLYAVYILGASLHASTDDEDAKSRWSDTGLSLSGGVLFVLALLASIDGLWPCVVVAALALARLARARHRLPLPAITGVVLSGLYLFHVSAVLMIRQPEPFLSYPAAALILLLFGASRLMLRSFPPT